MKAEIIKFPEHKPDVQFVVFDSKEKLVMFMELHERNKREEREEERVEKLETIIFMVGVFLSIVMFIGGIWYMAEILHNFVLIIIGWFK